MCHGSRVFIGVLIKNKLKRAAKVVNSEKNRHFFVFFNKNTIIPSVTLYTDMSNDGYDQYLK